jgi:cation transport regulator
LFRRFDMYESMKDLPDIVRDVLPHDAQEIYMEAYNRSWEMYDEERAGEMSREAVANRDGWSAVKREYTKDDDTGEWYPAGEVPEEAEEEDEGLLDKLGDIV